MTQMTDEIRTLIARFDDLLDRTRLYGPADALRDTWRTLRVSLLSEGAGAATPAAPAWQPIETAPIGTITEVLLCWDDGVAAPMFAVGYNLGGGRRWQTTHEWLHNEHSWPTHWMPRPLSPTEASSQGASSAPSGCTDFTDEACRYRTRDKNEWCYGCIAAWVHEAERGSAPSGGKE